MKINELLVKGDEPTPNGHYIADVIGMSSVGKKLSKQLSPAEKKRQKARMASMGASVSENLLDTFNEFRQILRSGKITKGNLADLMKKIDAEAKARGTPEHTMLDDLMSPLSVDQLKTIIKIAPEKIKVAAREELTDRL